MGTAQMTMMWLQQGDTVSLDNSKLLMIFIGIVALASVAQAVVVITMAVGAAKTRKELLAIVEEVKGKAMPLMMSTQDLVRDVTPKIKVITENLVETSHLVRAQAVELDAMLSDVNGKTRAQVGRVDGMVTSALNATAELAAAVHQGIRIPVREVVGIVSGLKAGLDVLVGRVKTFGAYGRGRNNDVEF